MYLNTSGFNPQSLFSARLATVSKWPQAFMHACKQASVFHGSVCYVRAYVFRQISRRPPFHISNRLLNLSQPLLTETLMHKGSIFKTNLLLVKYHSVTNMLQSQLSDPQHFENTWSAYLSKVIYYSRMICTSSYKLCQYHPSDLQHVRCSHKWVTLTTSRRPGMYRSSGPSTAAVQRGCRTPRQPSRWASRPKRARLWTSVSRCCCC